MKGLDMTLQHCVTLQHIIYSIFESLVLYTLLLHIVRLHWDWRYHTYWI